MKTKQIELTREQILLRAAFQLLELQDDSPFELNLICEAVVWDGVMCDGGCLMEEIRELLTETDVDVNFQEQEVN